jgi:glucose/arabinose dehydrogenase
MIPTMPVTRPGGGAGGRPCQGRGGGRARLLAALLMLAVLALAGPSRAADLPPEQEPGARDSVDAGKLPLPYATDSPANMPRVVDRPLQVPLKVPPGFLVNAFADGLDEPRWMTVAPNGDVFLAEPRAGRVLLLRDENGDGRAEMVVTFAEGFRRPHGLAIQGNALYVADIDAVWRLAWRPGVTRAEGPPQPVTSPGALGDAGAHWTRDLVFNRDGSRFFVAIGSNSNVGEDPSPHATVQSFAADGSDQQTYASGLRNPVGIALYPGTDDIWVTVNERDGMGEELVPDYLTLLKRGGFYGWPYAYLGKHPQPDMPQRPDLVAQSIVPDLLFRSHSAPLGLVFYEGGSFPERYRGGAFVALHGSWNRAQPTGYRVVWVPFRDGRPEGWYETFLSGFWIRGSSPAVVWGRPAGLAVAADGSLLVADDVSGAVWRVSYQP